LPDSDSDLEDDPFAISAERTRVIATSAINRSLPVPMEAANNRIALEHHDSALTILQSEVSTTATTSRRTLNNLLNINPTHL